MTDEFEEEPVELETGEVSEEGPEREELPDEVANPVFIDDDDPEFVEGQ
jgi:hypothetical protein